MGAPFTVEQLIEKSNKRLGVSGLNKVVYESAIEVIKRAYKEGIYVQYSAGYRSYAEQNALYAQGRTKPGSIVTNARGGYSNHNFGLAVDYFLYDKNGNAHWNVNSDWKRVAQIAKDLGFEWGGDWKSFYDAPHLEMTGGLSTAQLRAGKRPNLVSKVKNPASMPSTGSSSSGSSKKNYLSKGDSGSAVKTMQEKLNAAGFSVGKADGIFGTKTEAALKKFQKAVGIAADGLYGPNSKSKLESYKKPSSSKKSKGTIVLPKGVVSSGSSHADIKNVQTATSALYFYPDKGAKNNGIDGYWGPKTQDAIRRYQSTKSGLKTDGIYGPATRKALEKDLKAAGYTVK
ncbi:endolysin [Bacillus phage SP8]|nr:endolysin [Bacillus phage SP8]